MFWWATCRRWRFQRFKTQGAHILSGAVIDPIGIGITNSVPHSGKPRSHVGIVGTAPTLRRNPGDVGVWILDVAGFAVNAVLSVYDIL